jgi:hypothetical protein
VDLLQVRNRLAGRTHVRFGNDLDQGRAGAIQVDAGRGPQALVQRLAGILFEMRAGDANALEGTVLQHDVHVTLGHDGQLVLADLIALGQVRIEVILAREHRQRRDLRGDGQAELHRHAHGRLVQHRQDPRIA